MESQISDLERKFMEFRASSSAGSQIPDQPNLQIPSSSTDDVINRFMQHNPILVIPDEFKNLPSLDEILFLPTPNYDFPDTQWNKVPAYILPRYTAQEIAYLGRKTIPMLANGFTQQGIGILFILAYHLRVGGTKNEVYVFPSPVEITTLEDKDIFTLSESQTIKIREHKDLPVTHNIQGEAIAYAFIAASALRLFTKSPENYVKGFNHIMSSFEKFYGFPCPIIPPSPSLDALKSFKAHIAVYRHCKATLYRILYMSGKGNVATIGMKRFLYVNHLENTGMHIVGIFLRLCEVLNCESDLVLKVINTNQFEKQIKALKHLMQIVNSGDKKYERKMWRFGRLFDETFMSPLQTRSCPILTYTLASALKSVSSKGNENILDIVQLGDVSPERRRLLDKDAAVLIAKLKGTSIV